MSNLAFDTHQFVRDLTKANMPEAQAEVLARHYANLLNDRIATKDDINRLEARLVSSEERLDDRITSSEERLDDRITSLEERINDRITSEEERLNTRIDALEERLNARIDALETRFDNFEKHIESRILYVALRAQIAGVVVTCTVMGLMLSYFN